MTEKLNIVLLLLAFLAAATLPVFHALKTPFFHQTYAAEDGPVEWLTFLCLCACAFVLARQAIATRRAGGRRMAALLLGLYACAFLFAAGEEISWGQRIFGWEAGAFFTENSNRAETNLHNLKIGEVKLVQFLFGHVLTVVLLSYLVVLPVLYPALAVVQRLTEMFAVPVPHLHHAALALLASVAEAAVDLQRQWEIYELVFALLALSIFLLPRNARVFRPPPGAAPSPQKAMHPRA